MVGFPLESSKNTHILSIDFVSGFPLRQQISVSIGQKPLRIQDLSKGVPRKGLFATVTLGNPLSLITCVSAKYGSLGGGSWCGSQSISYNDCRELGKPSKIPLEK